MSSTMLGAEIDQLRSLASLFEDHSHQLQAAGDLIGGSPAARCFATSGSRRMHRRCGSQFERPAARFTASLKLTTATVSRVAAAHVDTEERWELAAGPADTVPDAVAVEADPSFGLLAKALA